MFCSRCGAENPDSGKFCVSCGGKLEAKAPPKAQQQPPQPVPQQVAQQPASPQVDQDALAASFLNRPPATDDVPDEIRGFNFGAFALNWIWCIPHNLWLYAALIFTVPVLNIVLSVYLGFKGNELAWKSRKFESVQQFKDTQRVWSIVGAVLFGIGILLCIPLAGILSAIMIPNLLRLQESNRYSQCSNALTTLSGAQMSYATANGVYTEDAAQLAPYMGRECADPSACVAELNKTMANSCKSFSISLTDGGRSYQILGVAKDRRGCNICITSGGVYPPSFEGCPATAGECM